MSRPLLIAQNLNASDPAVRAALAGGDAAWLRSCARRIEATGVDLIDCNAGTLGDAEESLLAWMVDQVVAMVGTGVAIDSARIDVLEAVGSRLRRPFLLNSLPVDFEPTEGLRRLLRRPEVSVVLSLRRSDGLPADASERMDLARDGLARLAAAGVPAHRVWIDAIALPVARDPRAASSMLDFVRAWASRGSDAGTLVGLGNLGHGRPDAVRIHREWMGLLRDAGIGAVLLDAFEPGLRALPSTDD